MLLVMKGYIGGKRKVIMQTYGEVRCEDGIMPALLADEISRKTCKVEILTKIDAPQEDADHIYREAKDTTLQDAKHQPSDGDECELHDLHSVDCRADRI